jgi:glyceraldehyde 3-phosphate dehydrogenase
LQVGDRSIGYSQESDPTSVPWRQAGVEMVLECSGRFKTPSTLQPYFDALGLQRVLVACPVKGVIAGAEALNLVFGINHQLYDPSQHRLVTAASCTTNCLAPLVKVVHETLASAMDRSPPSTMSPTPRWWWIRFRAICAVPAPHPRA